MTRVRIAAVFILVAAVLLGWFASTRPIHYGLDLSGGAQIVYDTDLSQIPQAERGEALSALRDVIERRVNAFGVGEPNVFIEESSIAGGGVSRLVVELPGVTDLDAALAEIDRTPNLEFKLFRNGESALPDPSDSTSTSTVIDLFEDTGLTGRFLKRATLQFGTGQLGSVLNEPVVALEFNAEGEELFAEITRNNIGEVLGIFLDGESLTLPVIQQAILDGQAVITGDFTPEEGRELVRNLNLGALPVPIELASTQTVGPTLGAEARDAGFAAGVVGLVLVGLFLLVWYRLPGLVAVVSLGIYMIIMFALFIAIPVTLTAAGIAGFILSIGMAVDANVLIFERIKEEFGQHGGRMQDAIRTASKRAWPSIRDGNTSSILTAIVLWWAGTTLTKGFALTWGIGIFVSMFTAIVVTRTFLLAISGQRMTRAKSFLYGIGFSNASVSESIVSGGAMKSDMNKKR